MGFAAIGSAAGVLSFFTPEPLDLLAGFLTPFFAFFADSFAPFPAGFLDDFCVAARFARARETFRFFVFFLTVLLRAFATTNSFTRSNKIVGILAS